MVEEKLMLLRQTRSTLTNTTNPKWHAQSLTCNKHKFNESVGQVHDAQHVHQHKVQA